MGIGSWAVEYRDPDGVKQYRYFTDMEQSRAFQESLPPVSRVVSRNTNMEDVFLEVTGRDVVATEEVTFRI